MNTEEIDKKKDAALDHKCPNCYAPLPFNPSVGKWKCEYCESEFTLEEIQKYANASSDANNKDVDEVDENVSYVSYKCKSCGAEIVTDEQTASTFCVYCGNTAIMKNKLTGVFKPDYIIPFKNSKEDAEKAFIGLAKGRPFMPKDFNSKQNIEKIKGVYIPFWLFDFDVSGSLNMNAQKIKHWNVGDTYYTKTDYYKLYRTSSMSFTKIPLDGSTRFDNDIMNSIEPFAYDELTKYNHAYLSGFLAERYDTEAEDIVDDAACRAISSARNIIFNDAIEFDTKTIEEDTLKSNLTNKQYALLPVWMVNVKYQDKLYTFAMNGQTGKFIGDIPLDKKKVTIWSILIFIGIFLGVLLITYIVHVMG